MAGSSVEDEPLLGDMHLNHDSQATLARTKTYSRNMHMWALLSLTVVLLAIGGGMGLGFLGRAFTKLCTNDQCAKAQGYEGCFGSLPFIGTILLVFVLPFGILCLGSLIIEFAHKLNRWSKTTVQVALGAITASCMTIVILSWIYLLRPATTFDVHWDGSNENDPFLNLIGGFVFLSFGAMTIVGVMVMIKVNNFRITKLDRNESSWTENLTMSSVSENIKAYFWVMALLIVLAFCCATFSSVWNYSAKSYFPAVSPYAVVQVHVNDKFVFKLYSDTIVFYGFIGFIATMGCLVHFNRGIRNIMHTRIVISGPLKNIFNVGISIGESVLGMMILGLFAYWLWFWRWGYDRIEKETQSKSIIAVCCNTSHTNPNDTCILPADEHAELQIWARVLGHMTTLTMSLLLLPAARNSVWDYIFGVPFERAIQYHRVLGVLAYTFLTSHMVLWLVKWGIEGTLRNNLWTLDYLQITPTLIHYDNFTIILTEITWLLVSAMVFIALFARRNNYELFYYTHHIAIIFYVVAIVHAWSFWYYAIGGLLLWLIDRCIRIVQASTFILINSITVNNDARVTILEFSVPNFKYYAGQYAWINIPCISHLEWHPFTISSSPSSPCLTMHIKDMGPNTFTNKVYNVARQYPLNTITLRVDGPYGRPLYFQEAKHLLLIAGGIGITPLHSILMEIYTRSRNGKSSGCIESVTLVWAVREASLLHIFNDLMSICRDTFVDVKFQFSFHITGAAQYASIGPSHEPGQDELSDVVMSYAKAGRPDLMALGNQFPPGRSTMVMVCGPEAMITNASDMALYFDFSFHHEVFTF